MRRAYRITYRKADAGAHVEAVYDITAESLMQAVAQANWQLQSAHEDHERYRCTWAREIDRSEVEGVPS